MDRTESGATFTDGTRVAIVGAGPAGCLLAAAILDAARARRRVAQVTLFDGGAQLGRTAGPMLLDPPALARLAGAGLPLPAGSCQPLGAARSLFDGASARTMLSAYSAPRGDGSDGDVGAHLRAAVMGRGARLLPLSVESVTSAADGTYALRASGRTERADLVVLACGAGAPVATGLAGHVPPPVLRGSSVSMELDEEGRLLHRGCVTHILRPGGPDILLVPRGPSLHILALGEDVSSRDLAMALAGAVARGQLSAPGALGPVRRVLSPAGAARPGLPAIGGALGGAPFACGLAQAAAQASRFAAALMDGGSVALADACAEEARTIESDVALRARSRRRLARFPEACARAVAREAHASPRHRPVTEALAALGDPTLPASALRRASHLLRTWLALLICALLALRDRLRGVAAAPAPATDEVFVVDDDAEQAGLLCDALGDRGFSTRAFNDGLSALAAAVRRPPAAVVLDVALPWLDGPAVCLALRSTGRRVPVVIVTALPLPLAGPEATRAGADAILIKPLDLDDLARRLSAWSRPRPRLPRPPRTESFAENRAQH